MHKLTSSCSSNPHWSYPRASRQRRLGRFLKKAVFILQDAVLFHCPERLKDQDWCYKMNVCWVPSRRRTNHCFVRIAIINPKVVQKQASLISGEPQKVPGPLHTDSQHTAIRSQDSGPHYGTPAEWSIGSFGLLFRLYPTFERANPRVLVRNPLGCISVSTRPCFFLGSGQARRRILDRYGGS